MAMRLLISLMLVTLAAGAGAAPQVADPLKSPDCLNALAALQQQEIEAAVRPGGSGGSAPAGPLVKREALRRMAAQTCLGGPADPPPAQRTVRPAMSAAPVTALPLAPQRARPAATLPPIQIPSLRTVTACDATGCWANDGTRLQRAGSSLIGPGGIGPGGIGPGGICQTQGSVLHCP
jgi:hypothetical protein